MKLKLDTRATHSPDVSAWGNCCQRFEIAANTLTAANTPTTVQPSTWARLLNPPTAFSFDEAWLLCQVSENQWLGWVPDYGEILLNLDEFFIPA